MGLLEKLAKEGVCALEEAEIDEDARWRLSSADYIVDFALYGKKDAVPVSYLVNLSSAVKTQIESVIKKARIIENYKTIQILIMKAEKDLRWRGTGPVWLDDPIITGDDDFPSDIDYLKDITLKIERALSRIEIADLEKEYGIKLKPTVKENPGVDAQGSSGLYQMLVTYDIDTDSSPVP